MTIVWGGESILRYGDLAAQVTKVKIYPSMSVHKHHYNEKDVWQTNQGLFQSLPETDI